MTRNRHRTVTAERQFPPGSYFHGGAAGLLIGSRILPPRETGCKDSTAAIAREQGWPVVAREDRVYITTEYMAAVMYAVARKNPTVYRVAPIGELDHDPDCSERGLSFECPAATVVEIIRPSRDELRVWLDYFATRTPAR